MVTKAALYIINPVVDEVWSSEGKSLRWGVKGTAEGMVWVEDWKRNDHILKLRYVSAIIIIIIITIIIIIIIIIIIVIIYYMRMAKGSHPTTKEVVFSCVPAVLSAENKF